MNEVPCGREVVDFEQLLSDFSSSFVRASVSEIDSEIERWIQHIVVGLGVDRGTLAEMDLHGSMRVTHQWAREGVSMPDLGSQVATKFPWTANKLLAGEVVAVSRLEDFPREAVEERAYAAINGGACTVAVPLRIGGIVVGAFSLGAVFSERTWTQEAVQRLQLVATVFGNALERKRAEAQIQNLTDELRYVSQIVSMGELSAALAHELNQPLAAIQMNAEEVLRMLAAREPKVSEIEAAIDDIIRDDYRAAQIVSNVRALFGRGEMRKSPLDIKELLADISKIVSADARLKNISLTLEVTDSLPPTNGDRIQLSQAILNLILNAFDAVSNTEGLREVTIGAEGGLGDSIQVFVRDSGKGINSKDLPRLYEPFFTTKANGMGMGLAIVRSIVENHGGRIWAAQNQIRGSTFRFELPVAKSKRP